MSTLVVNMHYQTLLATGWTQAEADFASQGLGENRATTTTAAVAVGATDIPVSSMAGLAAGMLIAMQADNGEFYSGRIYKIVNGSTLRLDRAITAPVAAGAVIGNFYRNDAHPNLNGGAAIIDDALRQLVGGRFKELEFRSKGTAGWSALGGATLSTTGSASYVNPGNSTLGEQGLVIDGVNVGGGAKSAPLFVEAGDHEVAVAINVGLRTGGYSGHVQVFVDERKADGSVATVGTGSPLLGYEGTYVSRVQFSTQPGSSITVRVATGNAGGYRFYLSTLEVFKLGEPVPNLNTGKHVVFGDSWVAELRAVPVRLAARLDQANVVAVGIPGNKASELIARFAADVTPHNPDFVWVMVGTNDYYAGVTSELFNKQIADIKNQILAIGATPIFFNPSVGALTYNPQKLHPSRSYAQSVSYYDMPPVNVEEYVESHASFQGVIPAGSTITAWVFPALTRTAAFVRYLLSSSAAFSIRFEYVTTSDGSGGTDAVVFPGAQLFTDIPMFRTNDQNRMIAMRVTNPLGYPVPAGITASVAWKKPTN